MRDKYNAPNADPARICAQIVSGMGFLGSATIFKSNNGDIRKNIEKLKSI